MPPVRIKPSVKGKLLSWGLAREIIIQIYTRLHDLPQGWEEKLGEEIINLNARSYSFVLFDPHRLPHRHLFVFAVRIDPQQNSLEIIACRHSTDETGEN